MTSSRFPYDKDPRWLGILAPLGVRNSHGVELTDDDRLVASFGWVSVDTPISNVDHTKVTGPHRWYTAVGLRLSFSDDGLTFGTNHRKGLCIAFKEKIPKVIGFRDHSALWVSVADPEGLAKAITSRQESAD
jgi:hypothetical protein